MKTRSKIGKIKVKKWLSAKIDAKYKELKIISKSLNRNSNSHFFRNKFHQLRKVCNSLCRKLKRGYNQELIKKLEILQSIDLNKF